MFISILAENFSSASAVNSPPTSANPEKYNSPPPASNASIYDLVPSSVGGPGLTPKSSHWNRVLGWMLKLPLQSPPLYLKVIWKGRSWHIVRIGGTVSQLWAPKGGVQEIDRSSTHASVGDKLVEGGVEGLVEGGEEGAEDGVVDGEVEGAEDGLVDGEVEGLLEGELEGDFDGVDEGEVEGDKDGLVDGEVVGNNDGLIDGEVDGDKDGFVDGEVDGGSSRRPQASS